MPYRERERGREGDTETPRPGDIEMQTPHTHRHPDTQAGKQEVRADGWKVWGISFGVPGIPNPT